MYQLQKTYDTVKAHLLTQGSSALSKEGTTCLYRATGGLKCAAGCLIPDEQYHESMEGKSFERVLALRPDVLGRSVSEEEALLIQRLQGVHDGSGFKYKDGWPEGSYARKDLLERLRWVAAEFGLTP